MPIEFVCSACGKTLRVGDEAAGKVVRCGGCATVQNAPAAAPPAPPAPPPPPPLPPARPRRPPREEPDTPRPGRGPRFWAAAGLALLAVGGGLGAWMYRLAAPRWQAFESADGGYAVDMPKAPRPRPFDRAALPADGMCARLALPAEDFVVGYTDVPPERRSLPEGQLFDESVARLLAASPGTAVERAAVIEVGGFPAREVLLSDPKRGPALVRLVLAEERAYTVLATGPDATHPRLRRFVESFRITDPRLLAAGAVRAEAARREEAARQEAARSEAAKHEAARREAERRTAAVAARQAAARVRPDPALVAADKLLADAFANKPCELSVVQSYEVPGGEVYIGFQNATPRAHVSGRGQTAGVDLPRGTVNAAGPNGLAAFLPGDSPGVAVTLADAWWRPAAYTVGGWLNVRVGPFELFGTDRGDATGAVRVGVAGGRLVARFPSDGTFTCPGEPASGVLSHPWPEGWHHVALADETTAAGRTVTLYLDGVAVRTANPPSIAFKWPGYPPYVYYGTYPYRPAKSEGTPDGKGGMVPPLVFEEAKPNPPVGGPVAAIDEVFLFGRALTEGELRKLAGPPVAAKPPPRGGDLAPPATDFPGLKFYLPCDEIKGTALKEAVSGKFVGKLTQADLTEGTRGKGLRLVSANYANTIGSVGLALTDTGLKFPDGAPVTLGFWARVHSANPLATIVVSRPDPTNPNRQSLVVQATRGRVTPVLLTSGSQLKTEPLFRQPTSLEDLDSWTHFALVRDAGNRVSWFVNGSDVTKPAAARVAAELLNWDNLDFVQTAYSANHTKFHAELDEICVFDRALGPDELKKLAGKGK